MAYQYMAVSMDFLGELCGSKYVKATVDLMVLAQKVDNGIVPEASFKVMFYYQPLVCGIAQTFLLTSLYCATLPTEYFIALKLSATFMAEHHNSCYKRLQTLYPHPLLRHFGYGKMAEQTLTLADCSRK